MPALRDEQALGALGALAHAARLKTFRALVRAGDEGLSAGAIAGLLGMAPSSLSHHLSQLAQAGLARQERRHRTIIYRADYSAADALVAYLMENCCQGEECAPADAKNPK